ncbi:cold shock domain-containing protein [Roseateles sp. LYH14W]|uniref:Cold shock domain-containing protein n=1 Tax=Pelomonas parva TaxID=3299032 RepID=A0ABW7F2D4_9BURK
MRSSGILRSWNEERGFGFIAPAQGGAELFVHISALPRDGSRPIVGETLTFELGRGKDGRPQAVNVVRTAVGADAPPPRRPSGKATRARTGSGLSTWLWRGATLVLLLVAGRWGYETFHARSHRLQLESQPPAVAAPDAMPASTAHRCDGRTQCTQMTSCAEATWFINHCPGTKMDSDSDGVPCEQQWCTGPGAR